MKSLEERLHDKGVRNLNDRLVDKNYYDFVLKHCSYFVNDTEGELDILTCKNGIYHYYEVKLSGCKQSYRHAKEQYHRFRDTHPDITVKGIYVPINNGKIRRIR